MRFKIFIVVGILILVMIFSGYMLYQSGFQPMTNKMFHTLPIDGSQHEPMPSDMGGMSFPGEKGQNFDQKQVKTNMIFPLYPMVTGELTSAISADEASHAV